MLLMTLFIVSLVVLGGVFVVIAHNVGLSKGSKASIKAEDAARAAHVRSLKSVKAFVTGTLVTTKGPKDMHDKVTKYIDEQVSRIPKGKQ